MTTQSKQPVKSITVKALKRTLKNGDLEIASTTTDINGRYQIDYTDYMKNNSLESVNLVVVVFAKIIQAESKMFLNANKKIEVNLAVGEKFTQDSEFKIISNAIDRHISPKEIRTDTYLTLSNLTEDQKVIVADEIKIDKSKLEKRLKVNGIISDFKKRNYRFDDVITEEVIYGIISNVTSSDVNIYTLLRQDSKSLTASLDSANSQNSIALPTKTTPEEVTSKLKDILVSYIMDNGKFSSESRSLKEVIDITSIESDESKKKFFKQYIQKSTLASDFWDSITGFSENEKKELKFAFDLDILTGRNISLSAEIFKDVKISKIEDLPAFINYDYLNSKIEASDSKKYYIKKTLNTIENTFPHKVTLHKMQNSFDFYRANADAVDFMLTTNNYDMGNISISDYIAENSMREPIEKINSLEKIQRQYKMAPRNEKFESVLFLSTHNLDTANDITKLTRSAFVNRYENADFAVSQDALEEIYENARQINTYTIAALTKYHKSLNGSKMFAMQLPESKIGNTKGGSADLETLFGNSNYVLYDKGRTTYSPAAYLTDLLTFLDNGNIIYNGASPDKKAGVNGGVFVDTAQARFFYRRPDIKQIMLNGKNSFEAMPYIDLVNEVLENAIAGSLNYQNNTTVDSQDLKIHPEFINYTAYKTLASVHEPVNFNLYREETKVYLDFLNINKPELMNLFSSNNSKKELNIALENLNLTKKDCELISTYDILVEPEIDAISIRGAISVSAITRFYNISYDELLEILDTEFVNPTGKKIIFADDLNLDIATATINLSDNQLKQAKIFNYLRKKLGWSAIELDRAIRGFSSATTTVGAKRFTNDFLIFLSDLKIVKEKYIDKPISELLVLWSNIDTYNDYLNEKSFYHQLFADMDADAPSGELRTPFTSGQTNEINVFLNEIAGASNLTVDDISEILNSNLNLLTSTTATIKNISVIMRISYLVDALGISVKQLISFMEVSGLKDPFGSTKNTINFIKRFKKLNDLGVDCDVVNYILYNKSISISPTSKMIDDFVEKLNNEINKIDETKYSLENYIGMIILDPIDREEFLSFIKNPKILNKDLKPFDENLRILIKQQISLVNRIQKKYNLFSDSKEAESNLVININNGKYRLTESSERAEYTKNNNIVNNDNVLIRLEKLKKNILIRLFSLEFNIDADNTKALLDQNQYYSGKTGYDIFLKNKIEYKKKNIYNLYAKISTLINIFHLKSSDLRYLIDNHSALGIIDLISELLPPIPPALSIQVSSLRYEKFEKIIDLYNISKQVFNSEFSVIDYLKFIADLSISETLKKEKLSKLSGWSKIDIEYFNTNLRLRYLGSSRNKYIVSDMLKLIEAFKIVAQSGSDAETVFKWKEFDFTVSNTLNTDRKIVSSIKNAAKFKSGKSNWKIAGRNIRDGLRIKQRDALENYLLKTRSEFTDASDLYAHYLIDPDVTPAVMTSRIKRAISSVQLFVQRSSLNLEKNISFDNDAMEEWKWRKNYRVWEANRKVFLYPENWIEPELRDDKSEFFEELEDEIMQVEVNNDNMEKVYYNYLKKLDIVSHLEIVGFHKEVSNDENEILHVVGKTRSTPAKYFYRKYQNNSWTSWSEINIGLEGEHIIPVSKKGKLYLFWPMFSESKVSTDNTESSYHNIKMAWSILENGQWASKRISKNQFIAFKSFKQNNVEIKNLTFRLGDYNNDNIIITFYNYKRTNSSLALFYSEFKFDLLKDDFTFSENKNMNKNISINIKNKIGCYFTKFMSYENYYMKFKNIYDKNHERIFYLSDYDDYQLGLFFVDNNYFLISPNNHEMLTTSDTSVFYEDEKNTFIITKTGSKDNFIKYKAETFYHPFTKLFTNEVFNNGAKGILDPNDPNLKYQMKKILLFNTNYLGASSADNKTERTYEDDLCFKVIEPDNGSIYTYNYLEYEDDLTFIVTSKDNATSSIIRNLLHSGNNYRMKIFINNIEKKVFDIRSISYNNNFRMEYDIGSTDLNEGENIIQMKLFKIVDGQESEKKTFFDPPFTINYQNTGISDKLEHIEKPYPVQEIELGYGKPYSTYNWELFFHIPLSIAETLSNNQKFEEARKWFHYIFDPTQSNSSFWRFKPFHEFRNIVTIEKLMEEINNDQHLNEVEDWEDNPFNPNLIARHRILPFMKTVVMKYMDNLLNWADQLFRRESIESINEATQLYILASDLLGKRPVGIKMDIGNDKTFDVIEEDLGPFANAYFRLHNSMVNSSTNQADSTRAVNNSQIVQVTPHYHRKNKGSSYISSLSSMFYFGIPQNDKLMEYYSTVSDRLFKIRHNMSIEGKLRELALFAPPIDPAMLVKAVAGGVDISSAINDLFVTSPQYKFEYILRKAEGLLGNVKSLGASLLSALEKRDAEELSIIKSVHEVSINESVKKIKEQLIEDAETTIETLENSLESANTRYKYYKSLKKISSFEKKQLSNLDNSNKRLKASQENSKIGSSASRYPDLGVSVSFGMSAGVSLSSSYGGSLLSRYYSHLSSKDQYKSSQYSFSANMNSIKGSHERRWDEWKHQEEMAKIEIKQVEKQIEGAKIKLAITAKELENHEMQIENSKVVYEYMKNKYTNKQLYNWMVSKLSGLYFRSYQLTYDVAKTAEKAYRRELFVESDTSSFIRFSHWESLKKGLLAGEQLQQSISEMDIDYMNKNKRKLEITKQIPLSLINPQALLDLKKGDGNNHFCSFELPEEIFDIDYPGQYQRIIKSVSITIPAVTGPYTNIGARVTISNSKIRKSATVVNDYKDDNNFVYVTAPVDSIATSNGVNDSGVFELNFRDERYIPFEGAGVISNWSIELPAEFKQFDYSTIKDIILTVKYTAKYDGCLKDTAVNNLRDDFLSHSENLIGAVSLKESFGDEFNELLAGNSISFNLDKQHFPAFLRNNAVEISNVFGVRRTGETYPPLASGIVENTDNNITINKISNIGATDDIVILYKYNI